MISAYFQCYIYAGMSPIDKVKRVICRNIIQQAYVLYNNTNKTISPTTEYYYIFKSLKYFHAKEPNLGKFLLKCLFSAYSKHKGSLNPSKVRTLIPTPAKWL